MSYDGYMRYNGVEVINVARVSRLAATLGIPGVHVPAKAVAFVERFTAANGGGSESVHYSEVAYAPWFDAQFPASSEFAGILPLSMQGLEDSTLESSVVEYTTDGGNSGSSRYATRPIVASVILIASTERGLAYGKQWLDATLDTKYVPMNPNKAPASLYRAGPYLYYAPYIDAAPTGNSPYAAPEAVHRRNMRLTRGTSVTKRKVSSCSAVMYVTFTWTSGDPFEYGEPVLKIDSIGGAEATGPGVYASGAFRASHEECPVYDYTPIYDPLYPALVVPPAPPNFFPPGWPLVKSANYYRSWAAMTAVEPTAGIVVPFIKITGQVEGGGLRIGPTRYIRISIWSPNNPATVHCGPLYSMVVSYLPASETLYIDGEQQAAYFWDEVSPYVRRADTLIFSDTGGPARWDEFIGADGYLVTVDFYDSLTESNPVEEDRNVRAEVSLIAKTK